MDKTEVDALISMTKKILYCRTRFWLDGSKGSVRYILQENNPGMNLSNFDEVWELPSVQSEIARAEGDRRKQLDLQTEALNRGSFIFDRIGLE